MLTARENYLIAAKGGKPERIPVFPLDISMWAPPLWAVDRETLFDVTGVKWILEDEGDVPDPSYQALEDVADWRDVLKLPPVDELPWQQWYDEFIESDFYDADKIQICMVNSHGVFLIPINMMGWVDGLCAMYDDPEEYKALVDYITDYLVAMIAKIGEYFHPDIIFSGDDFSNSTGPFISPEVWEEFFAANLKKISDAIHAVGALAEFHCCGNNKWLTDKILEAGFDIHQLAMPTEEYIADKKRYGNKLVVTGGWERHGEAGVCGAPEEVVRKSVRDACDIFGKDGAFIFWDGGIAGTSEDSKQKMDWVLDEVMTYGATFYQD